MKMKVTVEMDEEAFDLIMVRALGDHILYTYSDFVSLHPDDVEWNEKLKESLWVVFEYFVGEEKAKDLKNLIEGGEDEV
jgi:hypothetical protein